MQTFVVNIQPARLASFSEAAITSLLAVEAPSGLIVKSGMDEGVEPAPYFLVTFQTGKINALWPLVRVVVIAPELGHGLLASAPIVTENAGNLHVTLQHEIARHGAVSANNFM